eukprot:191569-Prymnesium_polylepis.1
MTAGQFDLVYSGSMLALESAIDLVCPYQTPPLQCAASASPKSVCLVHSLHTHTLAHAHLASVADSLSFTMASMMASTIFFWLRLGSVHEKYKSAMVITGLVTFIAAYHYIRIFNSWTEAYAFPAAVDGQTLAPTITGQPFNDAYRYMDWLLTVPLLLIEIVFVMKLDAKETASMATSLGFFAGLMIVLGYPGELIIEGDLNVRWMWWGAAMLPFLYV